MSASIEALQNVTNSMYQLAYKYGCNSQLDRVLDVIDELADKSENGYVPLADTLETIVQDAVSGINYKDTVCEESLNLAMEEYCS